MRRTGVRALALALAALAGACASDQTAALLPAAVAPPETPPVARPAPDRDHAKLVQAFGGEYRSPAAQALVTEVADRLVKATDRPDEAYAVTLLDSAAVNAFALPTGRLYVTRGLLALANDTSELAAVLSHEIAHVALRHAVARSEMALRSALVSKVVSDVLNDPATGALMDSQSRFALASFSRAQELEADQAGVRTLARAGYDPFGASRFLNALNRMTALRAGGGGGGPPDMLATHPSTAERIALATQAARRIGAPGLGAEDRERLLAAVDGIAYGDNPGDGVVRGRRFLHPRLGVAFENPEGFALENTPAAVLGATADGGRRLLFDTVESRVGQSLEDVLRATWNEAIQGRVESRMVSGFPVAVALSQGKDWSFRLAAIRVGPNTFRMIMAGKGTTDVAPAFERWIASVALLPAEEGRSLQPQRLQVVAAAPGDTAERLAGRMAVADRPLERFLALNGLERGAALRPGQRVKLVVD